MAKYLHQLHTHSEMGSQTFTFILRFIVSKSHDIVSIDRFVDVVAIVFAYIVVAVSLFFVIVQFMLCFCFDTFWLRCFSDMLTRYTHLFCCFDIIMILISQSRKKHQLWQCVYIDLINRLKSKQKRVK